MLEATRPDLPRPLALLSVIIDVALALAGAGLAVLVFGNVLSRFIFRWDVAWSGELVTFLLVWGSFVGGAAAIARGAHMRITELVTALPGAARLVLEAVAQLLVLALLVMVVWQGIEICIRTWEQETSVLYWPQGLLYAGMPVGAALGVPFLVWDLVLLARGRLPRWSEG